MTDLPIDALVAAVIARARQYGAKEIRFADEGPVIVDRAGNEIALGLKPGITIEPRHVADYLDDKGNRNSLRRGWRGPENERYIDNSPYLLTEIEGIPCLQPKKPAKEVLEQLAEFDVDQLARLRKLYGQPGMAIYLDIEGTTRGAEIHEAIAIELRMAGLEVDATFRRGDSRSWNAVKDIPDIFAPADGWRFETAERLTREQSDPLAQTKVILLREYRRYGTNYGAALQEIPESIVVIEVALRNSVPTAAIHFSPSALEATLAATPLRDAPWDAVNERLATRKAIPRPPKTWHANTNDVAKAYVLQEAPRGYVSGKSIYFHGPIAYSEYDSQPIAAMVEREDKETAILMSSYRSNGGNGVASSMQRDIQLACEGKDIEVMRVDDLREIMKIGDTDLKIFPFLRRKDKAERDHPARCTIDPEAVAAWLRDVVSAGEKAVEEAFAGAPYPTLRKIGAYEDILKAERHRIAFRDILGIELDPVFDVVTVTARRDEIRLGYDERKAELAARKANAEPAGPRGP